jgi:hypothetical protein
MLPLQETAKFTRDQITYDGPLVSYLTYDGPNSALSEPATPAPLRPRHHPRAAAGPDAPSDRRPWRPLRPRHPSPSRRPRAQGGGPGGRRARLTYDGPRPPS